MSSPSRDFQGVVFDRPLVSSAPVPARRELTDKDFAYDKLDDRWEALVSHYDTGRRVEVVIDDFLGAAGVEGKRCLDAGSGLGYFLERLSELQASELCAIDIGPALVARLKRRMPEAEICVADMMDLDSSLGQSTFDVIVCSEAIEHTPDPRRAVAQLARRLRRNGVLALSCPNRVWRWSLSTVRALGLRRHYAGYENWVWPSDLLAWLQEAGLEIERAEGVHLVPWQVVPKALLRRVDVALRQHSYSFAVVLAVLARRP